MVLVYAIVKAQEYGWGSAARSGCRAVAAALLAAFVAIELPQHGAARPAAHLPQARRSPARTSAMTLVAAGMFSMFFFASLYVQDVLGYSPLKAGFAFLPVTVGIIVGAGAAQRPIKRFGAAGGRPCRACSSPRRHVLADRRCRCTAATSSDLLPGCFPMSLGMGLTFVPVTLLATAGVSAEDSGSRPACSTPPSRSAARSGWPSCRPCRRAAPRVLRLPRRIAPRRARRPAGRWPSSAARSCWFGCATLVVGCAAAISSTSTWTRRCRWRHDPLCEHRDPPFARRRRAQPQAPAGRCGGGLRRAWPGGQHGGDRPPRRRRAGHGVPPLPDQGRPGGGDRRRPAGGDHRTATQAARADPPRGRRVLAFMAELARCTCATAA